MDSLDQPGVIETQPSETEDSVVNDLIGDESILVNVQDIPPGDMRHPLDVVEWKCFICDLHLTTEISYSVFYTTLNKSGVLLSHALNKTLKTKHSAPHTMRSPVICNVCFNLFDELELAEQQCNSLRNTLISGYRKTCELYGQMVEHESTTSVSCQTQDIHPRKSVGISDTTQPASSPLVPPVAIKQEHSVTKSRTRRSLRKSKTKKRSSKPIPEDVQSGLSEVDDDEDREAQYTREDNDSDEERDAQLPHEDSEEEPIHIDYSDQIKSDPDNMSDAEDSRKKRKRRKRKKYKCDHCPRTFRRPGELKNHILVTHVGKNPNQCVYCQKKFNSRNGLYVHLKKIHRMDYEHRQKIKLGEGDTFEEQVPSLIVNVELADSEPLESAGASDIEGTEEDRDGNSADSEWTEEAGSQKKTKRTRRTRSVDHARRKEKENWGARDNASRRPTVRRLREEVIGDEMKVKEEKGDDEVEEGSRKCKEELRSGGEDAETISGGEGGEKKRKRSSRMGERACMPLIHACPTCGKKWRTVSELNAHIQTHSDLRPFVCEICGQGYKMQKALDVHVGMHNGIHPFTCHYCNKSFTQKVGLQKHLPIHTGYSRFQCDLCGKRFIHQKSFQIHKMVHSGERNIKCSVCNLAVLSTSHLKRHFRSHTGERPYECSTCGKRFAEKYNLNAHQKIHLPPGDTDVKDGAPNASRKRSSRQKCQVCGFMSSRRCSLQQHWEDEHKALLLGDEQYPHDAPSPPSDRNQVSSGIIPQMIIDPSGSITYEEKPRFSQQLMFAPPVSGGIALLPN